MLKFKKIHTKWINKIICRTTLIYLKVICSNKVQYWFLRLTTN